MRRFNVWLADRMARFMQSMLCFWLIEILVLVPLAAPQFLPEVQFISSGWFQAIALPVLAVYGALSAAEIMTLIRETHDTVMAMHKEHQAEIAALHEKQNALHAHITKGAE